MPRDGAIIFADLIGKLDVLYVHCSKCGRADGYRMQHLIGERGRDGRVIDWLDEITALSGSASRAFRNLREWPALHLQ